MLRVLAAAIAITTPTAALAAQPTTAAILASSVFAQDAQPEVAAPPVEPVRIDLKRKKQTHRSVAADLREMQAFEYRPAQDYRARPEGFAVQGKKLSFFRTF